MSASRRTKKSPVIAMLCAILSLVASPARAGTQVGYITSLTVRDTDGLIYFHLSGVPTDKPACVVYQGWSLPNENSETGKKLFAMLTSARVAGQQVSVSGKNTCIRWGDQKDVEAISLSD